MSFTKSLQIPFFFADAAGILFFSRSADLFHLAYEDWWQEFSAWEDTFQNPDLAIPLLSWHVEFKKPLRAGERIDLKLGVLEIGESSFLLESKAYFEDQLCFQSSSRHVFIYPKTQKKINIPDKRLAFLKEYLL